MVSQIFFHLVLGPATPMITFFCSSKLSV